MDAYRRMTIEATGRVGIGTRYPTEKLEVAGGGFFNQEDGGLVVDANGQKRVGLIKYTGRVAGLWRVANQSFEIGRTDVTSLPGTPSAFTTDMFFSGNGDVGIGTNDPQGKLAVNGTIFSKKVKVTVAGWPDYVFDPEYKLPTLKEVEAFIRANRHLPDVPSAAAIEKDRLDLGDNQALLLKKIEEMTLYLIDQDKRFDDMKKRAEEQQEEIESLKKMLKSLTADK